jgi:hypothetical protein
LHEPPSDTIRATSRSWNPNCSWISAVAGVAISAAIAAPAARLAVVSRRKRGEAIWVTLRFCL